MSELDSSREGEQERWGAGKERGRRDMEVLTPDPKVWGRKGRAGRERPAFRSPRRAAARAAVGGGAGGHSTWMPGPEGQLQALPTLPGSGPGGRPPQPRGPGRSYDGGAAAVRRGSQVSLDAPCARAMSCRAGVGKVQGERSLGSLASRRGCRWLTARRDRSREEGIMFMPPRPASPWAVPARGRPRAPVAPQPAEAPSAPGSSCPVLGSREQAGSPEVPALPLGLRGGRSPGRDHEGQADPHRRRQRAALAPPRFLASSSCSRPGVFLDLPAHRPPRCTTPSPPLVSAVPGTREPFAGSTRELHMDKLPWLALFLSLLDAAPILLQLWGQRVTFLPVPAPLHCSGRPGRCSHDPPACSLPFERIRTK